MVKVKEIKVLLDKLMTTVWECFYAEVLDKFADISYGYSITTHKSQGSTFRSVYLHLGNIINCNSNEEESYRCLYTALTRSSKKVHILSELNKFIGNYICQQLIRTHILFYLIYYIVIL